MSGTNQHNTAIVEKLIGILGKRRRLVIIGHDHPDPDYLASALALKHIARTRSGVPSVITSGGVLGRAENRTMVRLLKIKLTPLTKIKFKTGTAVALLDTQPGTGNNSLPPGIKPLIIIDHHPRRPETDAPLVDIRPEAGATSSILAGYLRTMDADLPSNLATALVYGIASETQDLGRESSREDIESYLFALRKANKKQLGTIRHPKVSRYYFVAMDRALHSAFYYRNIIGTRLGGVEQPDVISQMADLLLSHERMTWSICSGFFGDELLFSARSSNIKAKLGTLLRRMVARKGTAGGHELSAGAQVDCRDMSPAERLRLEEELLLKFMRLITHRKDVEPRALIPRK
jgi:nanoRNase/pAp phosphatase (c-di-AMP/oligoRNAs hydrolase)